MAGITAFVGLTGGGKTYSAMELAILPALQEGRHIITNFPLVEDTIRRDFPDASIESFDFDRQYDKAYWDNLKKGSLVALDELWRPWPAGLQSKDLPEYQMSLLKEQRHRSDERGRSMDIVLVTQVLDDIAKSVRDQVHVTIVSEKLDAVGVDNRFRRDYYQRAIKGHAGPAKQFSKSDYAGYRPEVYRYYRTHTMSEGQGIQPDEKPLVKFSLFSGIKAKLILFMLLGLIPLVIVKGCQYRQSLQQQMAGKPEADPAQSRPAGKASAHTAGRPPASRSHAANASKPDYSDGWRIVGKLPPYLYLSNGSSLRRVDHCPMADFIDLRCVVDGELVTVFTGALSASGAAVESSL